MSVLDWVGSDASTTACILISNKVRSRRCPVLMSRASTSTKCEKGSTIIALGVPHFIVHLQGGDGIPTVSEISAMFTISSSAYLFADGIGGALVGFHDTHYS